MTTNLSNPKDFERRFIKWLKKQDPNREFDYFNCDKYMFAAFARENKFPLSHSGGDSLSIVNKDKEENCHSDETSRRCCYARRYFYCSRCFNLFGVMTIPYTEIAIPNSEMIVFSAKRTLPADIYFLDSGFQDDRFICAVDYMGVAFDVVMSNN